MAITRQAGSGMKLTPRPLYPTNPNVISNTNSFNTYQDALALGSGETFVIPAGQWYVTPGLYTFIQVRDPITNLWRVQEQTPNTTRFVTSDGVNTRVANLTGCALGALVTNVGSGYTSAPTVTASSGSSAWTAIVGGAINSTVTITTAGAGYSHKPMLIVEPPPNGGIPATVIVSTVSGGAITGVTVIDQGAGYTSAPAITVVPDPRDTVTTLAVLTTALTGSGTITAIVCTDHGTPLTAVPTLTISGGGGSSAAATAVMCFTATGLTITNAGAAYGNALPVLVNIAGGRITTAAGAVVNPNTGVGLINPRQGIGTLISEAGGTLVNQPTFDDSGLFSKVPTAFFISSNPTVATTNAVATVTVGGVTDFCKLVPF